MSKKEKIKSAIYKIIWILKQTEINTKALVLGFFLATLLVILNFVLLSFLFPIINLILEQDLSIVQNIKYFNVLIPALGIENSFWKVLIVLGGALYLVTIVKSIIRYFSFVSINLQAKTASNKIRQIIFKRYLSFGKLFFDNKNLSELDRTLLDSSNVIHQTLDTVNRIIIDTLTLAVYLGFLFFISWKLTLFAFPFLVFLYFFSNKIKNKIRQLTREREATQKKFLNKISEIINCMILVKGFGREKEEEKEFLYQSQKEIESNIKIQKKQQILAPVEEMISTSTILIIAGSVALISLYDPNFALGHGMVFMYILYRIPSQISAIQSKQTSMIAYEEKLKDIELLLDDKEKYIFSGGEKIFTQLQKSIEFKNLTFGYTSKNVLHNISFNITKGEKIAIIGKTGSGKTTISNLLLRFYDCPEGTILIDGIDIREFTLESLKKHFAFVTQNTILFNDTIRANILYSDPNVAQERFEEIIKKLDIEEITDKFAEKTNYVVGERGNKLSGGEKQRISLARALIKDASIIVLDEPTSSLDAKTEKNITNAIQEMWKDKTMVIIAHKISTIMHCDRVLVIEGGKIIEQGNPKELIEKKGEFYKYYDVN